MREKSVDLSDDPEILGYPIRLWWFLIFKPLIYLGGFLTLFGLLGVVIDAGMATFLMGGTIAIHGLLFMDSRWYRKIVIGLN